MSSWINRGKRDNVRNEAVVCAIALNEERYIDEWIQYHLKLGFSHIFIYDNSTEYVLKYKNSEHVTIFHQPGKAKQLEVFNVFVLNYRRKYKWAAFIDLDEFIVLKKHRTIMNLLNEYQDCPALVLNWLMFGTNHEMVYRDEPVTKRFQKCSHQVHEHFKSVCQLADIHNYSSPHGPTLLSNKKWMDTNRTVVESLFHPNGPSDVAVIHHYYTKSEEECRKKILGPRPDIDGERNHSILTNLHEYFNDVENQDAWNLYTS